MTDHHDEPTTRGTEDPEGDDAAPGVEISTTDGEGSTFEPEEDPDGHVGGAGSP